MQCFVDTSAWFALLRETEHAHSQVAKVYTRFLDDGTRLVTTTEVLGELYTLTVARLGTPGMWFWEFLKLCRESSSIDVLHPSPAVVDKAWKLLMTCSDKTYSFVDAISFALMRANGIETALTLDRHFAQEGFRVLPESPTTVHER